MVFSFYPINDRVENQGFGRAARGSHVGSGRFLLSEEDPAVKGVVQIARKRFFNIDPHDQLTLLSDQRLREIARLSKKRSVRAIVERLDHEVLERFFVQTDRQIDQLTTYVWNEKASILKRPQKRKSFKNFVERVDQTDKASKREFGLLLHLCKLHRLHSEKELAIDSTIAVKELKFSIYQLWSEHFYSKLDSFSQHRIRSRFDEDTYCPDLMRIYGEKSKRWSFSHCNCAGENEFRV